MRRIMAACVSILLTMLFCFHGRCLAERQKYQAVCYDVFDTVTVVSGYDESEAGFQEKYDAFHERMLTLHRLYDIYNEYEGINNLCTVNRLAGETVTVDQEVIDLLLFAREVDAFSGGRTNAAMGSVLRLWHEAREAGIAAPEEAYLPEMAALEMAAEHTGFEFVMIDAEQRTVRLTDEETELDVGALAKGYAVQRAAEGLPEGWLISCGGNIYATGPKPDGSAWTVGVQDPTDPETLIDKLRIERGAVVSSGDYQRYYTVDGKNYHHIIDPDTLMPASLWHGVTVICDDSGLADGLSTTLFLMTREEGMALLERFDAEAIWMDLEGNVFYSSGCEQYRK